MRKKNDAYYTISKVAAGCVNALAPYIPWAPITYGLEPSCGGLSFVYAMREYARNKPDGPVVMQGVDLYETSRYAPDKGEGDYFAFDYFSSNFLSFRVMPHINFAIGNPPYAEAKEHLMHLFSQVTWPNFAAGFLLRAGFRHSLKRKWFWDHYPCYALKAIRRRPSFTGDGKTDASEYDFIIWKKQDDVWLGNEHLTWID